METSFGGKFSPILLLLKWLALKNTECNPPLTPKQTGSGVTRSQRLFKRFESARSFAAWFVI
jgi:hypothetical protein